MRKILCVDDDPVIHKVFKRLLNKVGLEVVTCLNAREALAVFKPGEFVLLTDITMPGISGIELARQILEIEENVPVVLVSGNALEEHVLAELPSTANVQFLTKPFVAMRDVLALLEKYAGY